MMLLLVINVFVELLRKDLYCKNEYTDKFEFETAILVPLRYYYSFFIYIF